MRKAQIKMFESIAVMVVFAFLLVFGVNFYFTIQKTSVEREVSRANQLRVFSLAQKTAFLPELDCAIAGIQQEACIDTSKLNALQGLLSTDTSAQELYFPVFGWSTVKVHQLFPVDNTFSVPLYDNPLPKSTQMNKVQTPILLYNATTGDNGFGYIEVTSYAK